MSTSTILATIRADHVLPGDVWMNYDERLEAQAVHLGTTDARNVGMEVQYLDSDTPALPRLVCYLPDAELDLIARRSVDLQVMATEIEQLLVDPGPMRAGLIETESCDWDTRHNEHVRRNLRTRLAAYAAALTTEAQQVSHP